MKLSSYRLALIVVGATLCGSAAWAASENYVAHEWGTFTSVQGADGVALEWNPLTTAELPDFVYDQMHPYGPPGRQLTAFLGKSMFRTLQRMERPVIYFYSDREREVDVTVKFPEGLVTEWYPQVHDFGHSSVRPRPSLTAIDDAVEKVGLPIHLSSLDTKKSISESMIRWSGVRIEPGGQESVAKASLPQEKSGSHYYAARETDANIIQVKSNVGNHQATEHEKFLFYRGIGNFKTPLLVTVSGDADQFIKLQNVGAERLDHLFLVVVQKGLGKFFPVKQLAAQADETFQIDPRQKTLGQLQLEEQLGGALERGLVAEGLYQPEAAAMVKTWRDSWLKEEGVRVLYLLPRAWTDRTLPLNITPAPEKLVRVMMGRAEVLTPKMEWNLLKGVVHYSDATPATKQSIIEEIHELGLGRFSEPALRRVLGRNPSTEFSQAGWELIAAASKARAKDNALVQK